MNKRIYLVTFHGGNRLIRASSPAQAIRYAASTHYHAEVATQEALVGLLGSGIKVENAVEPGPGTPPATE